MITIGDKTIEVSETAGTSIGSEETPVLDIFGVTINGSSILGYDVSTMRINSLGSPSRVGSDFAPFDTIYGSSIFGNVNTAGTTNVVYGAVFN